MTDLAGLDVPRGRAGAAGGRLAPLRRAAPALLGYAAVRLLGLVMLALWSADGDKGVVRLLSQRWDSVW